MSIAWLYSAFAKLDLFSYCRWSDSLGEHGSRYVVRVCGTSIRLLTLHQAACLSTRRRRRISWSQKYLACEPEDGILDIICVPPVATSHPPHVADDDAAWKRGGDLSFSTIYFITCANRMHLSGDWTQTLVLDLCSPARDCDTLWRVAVRRPLTQAP